MAHTATKKDIKSAVKKATHAQRKRMIKTLKDRKSERINKRYKKKMGKKGGYA